MLKRYKVLIDKAFYEAWKLEEIGTIQLCKFRNIKAVAYSIPHNTSNL